jgi:hypothetical protein
MKRYAIRRNPGTGRWIMYYLQGWPERRAKIFALYRIMGSADTYLHAIEGIYEEGIYE